MSEKKPWEWLAAAAEHLERLADAAVAAPGPAGDVEAQAAWSGAMAPVLGPLLAEMLRHEAGMLRAEIVTGGSMDHPFLRDYVYKHHGAAIRLSRLVTGDEVTP